MKVLYLTNIPSPYRVNYFNELGKKCDLTVLFETETSIERDESWKDYQFEHFKGIILKGKRTSLDTAFCPSVVRYLKKRCYNFIIVTVLASPTGILAAAWLKMHHIPYYYEGDGGIAGRRNGVRAWLKKFVIASARLCFSTTKDFDEYCLTYGASRERIVRYPFTSIYEEDILKEVPDREQKAEWKRMLGITEEKIILSVGRVIPLKGYDVLLKAFAALDEEAWGIYIVGGNSTQELDDILKQYNLKHVHFIEFKLYRELKKYYEAADIFVLPTRYDTWGLVINEAMACGLPVITTYTCGAGTEMIDHGRNGYLYEPEDSGMLGQHLGSLMRSEKLRKQMGRQALHTAEGYTIEAMAEAHYHILEEEAGNGKVNRK